jgi:hypothetical protein
MGTEKKAENALNDAGVFVLFLLQNKKPIKGSNVN